MCVSLRYGSNGATFLAEAGNAIVGAGYPVDSGDPLHLVVSPRAPSDVLDHGRCCAVRKLTRNAPYPQTR